MFNVGGMQLLMVALVALVVLGPDKLPAFIRQAGQVVSELRRISSGFQADLQGALQEAERESSLETATETASRTKASEKASPTPADNDTGGSSDPAERGSAGGPNEKTDAVEDAAALSAETRRDADAARLAAAAELEALLADSGSPGIADNGSAEPGSGDDPQPGGGDGPGSGSATDAA